MLHIKYQSSMPSSFREELFWSFHFLFPCSNLRSPGRGKFWAKGHHMNKLGRGTLGNATHQISKLHAFQFQRDRILKLVCFVLMFHLVSPGRGQFWPQGHHMNELGRGTRRCYKPNIKAKYERYSPYGFFHCCHGNQSSSQTDDWPITITHPEHAIALMFFFHSVAMATRVLHGIHFFEVFWKSMT